MFFRFVGLVCIALTAAQAGDPAVRRIKKDVYFLASDKMKGRPAGSPELENAAEFLAQRMWHLGLQPGTAGGWFQAVPVHSATAKSMTVTIEAGGQKFTLSGDNVRALAARPADVSGAGVIKVTRETAGRLKPDDVKGKVLVATEMGRIRGLQPAMVILASAGEARTMSMMPAVMPALQGTPGRSPYPTLLTADEAFSKWVSGLPTGPVADAKATGRVDVNDRDFELRNVIGVLPGSDPTLRDSYVLVTAHYDHIGELQSGQGDRIRNGANDDASGTATMLAVAKMLSTGKTKPKRTVVFIAWTGEEAGGLGSQWYAKHPIYPLAKTVANINLEQTGRYDGEGGSGKGRALVTGYGFSDIGKILTDAAKPAGLEVYAGPDDFFARSDNVFLAMAGVPAHTVGSSLEFPDYHGVGDSAEKLDYDNMAVIARGVAAGVLAIANSATEPQWADVPAAAPYRKVRAAGEKRQ